MCSEEHNTHQIALIIWDCQQLRLVQVELVQLNHRAVDMLALL